MARILLAMIFMASVANSYAAEKPAQHPQLKILKILLDKNGWIYMGRDTLSLDKVAYEVQQRLWKSYLGTGKMPDQIQIELQGDVLPTVSGAAKEAIKQGQQKALDEYCISKFEKPFDKLSSSQADKVRRKYPVLFQAL